MNSISQRIARLSPVKLDLLARQLREVSGPRSRIERLDRPPGAHQIFPLSFAQQRLWFLSRLDQESSIYNITKCVRLAGTLNISALEDCLREMGRRHEILRTTFAVIDGKPMQLVNPTMQLKMSLVILSGLSGAQREIEMNRLAISEADRPFDLEQGPLLRIILFRLDDFDHVALLTMHHIISDAWSIGIWISELMTLYCAFSKGVPSPLPDHKIQYADFASWQQEWLGGNVMQDQLTYWKRKLTGSPISLKFAPDSPRQERDCGKASRQSLAITKELTDKAKMLSRKERTTLFVTLMTVFNMLLSHYSDQEDILIGTLIANRSRADVRGLIGFFVNTLAMRTDLTGDPVFRKLLAQVKDLTLEAHANQDLPFERLVQELQPERSLSHSPLFQYVFLLQNAPASNFELPGLSVHPVDIRTSTIPFDLVFRAIEQDRVLVTVIDYRSSSFDANTIARMLRHFETLLSQAIANPDARLSELKQSLLESDRQQELIRRQELEQARLEKFKKGKRKAIVAYQ
jgi:Condensation domain